MFHVLNVICLEVSKILECDKQTIEQAIQQASTHDYHILDNNDDSSIAACTNEDLSAFALIPLSMIAIIPTKKPTGEKGRKIREGYGQREKEKEKEKEKEREREREREREKRGREKREEERERERERRGG